MTFKSQPAYSAADDTIRMKEADPESTHYISETLADVTDGADATYYYYVDMDSYRKGGWQLVLDGGSGTCTVTVEATLQDDGTAMASCTYEDMSSDVFGSASWTADAVLLDNAEALAVAKYVRFKVVASTGGADDADWTIYHVRLY